MLGLIDIELGEMLSWWGDVWEKMALSTLLCLKEILGGVESR